MSADPLDKYLESSPKPIAERVSAAIKEALKTSSDPDFLTSIALKEHGLVLYETGREITVRPVTDTSKQVKDAMSSYYYETRASDKRQAKLHLEYGKEMAALISQIGNPNWAAGHFLYQFVKPSCYWESGLDDVLNMFISCYAEDKIFPTFLELHDLLEKGGYNESNTIDWGDADGDICFIPHDKFKIVLYHNFVSCAEFPGWIAIYDPSGYSKKFYVRAVDSRDPDYEDYKHYYTDPYTIDQYRSVDFKIKFDEPNPVRLYGDCRDRGHILTLDTVGVLPHHPNADKASWSYGAAMHFGGDLSHMVDEVKLCGGDRNE